MTHKATTYQALPDCLTIKPSKLHGLGLFAAQALSPGRDLGISHIADGRFPNDYARTPVGAFINYSRDPNCECAKVDDTFRLKTLRSIASGAELTGAYEDWYDDATLATFRDG